jgi:hypothetical protein
MTAAETLFWEMAEPYLKEGRAERGTLMGFPCLRAGGAFVAVPDHKRGNAVFKLDRERVAALVQEGVGQPFAPAGRVFKEWVAVSVEHRDAWSGLLEEGMARAEGG